MAARPGTSVKKEKEKCLYQEQRFELVWSRTTAWTTVLRHNPFAERAAHTWGAPPARTSQSLKKFTTNKKPPRVSVTEGAPIESGSV
jgi:hypothetical protein